MKELTPLSKQAKARVLGEVRFVVETDALRPKKTTRGASSMRNPGRILMNPEGVDFDEVVFQALDEEYQEAEKFEVVDQESIKVDRQAKAHSQQHNVSYVEALTALGYTF